MKTTRKRYSADFKAKVALEAGEPVAIVLERAVQGLLSIGFSAVDYFALADAVSLERLDRLDRPGRLLAAARIGHRQDFT